MTGVLFIVGASRSGSTLLERLLNELPSVMSVGELMRVWQRGFVENQLCSCRQPFQDCPFWGEVRQRLDADGVVDAGAVDALSRRAFKRGLRPRPTGEAILTHWSRLFRAIADVSGARWLVDSSKDPVYAAQLAHLSGRWRIPRCGGACARKSTGPRPTWQRARPGAAPAAGTTPSA